MVSFLAVTWDVDPVMFKVWNFEVMWYGLAWMLAILGGAMFFVDFGRREGLSPKLADNIFWWGTLATIIGARLGHCFFYEPGYYFTHLKEIFYIRQGGMASHGAAIGLLLGLYGFARNAGSKKFFPFIRKIGRLFGMNVPELKPQGKLPYIWPLDRIMVPVTLGGAIVRFGNLINSEIYGRTTDLPWGFIFVRNGETLPMHPTQIYEALSYLVTFAILMVLYYVYDAGRKRPGVMFGVGLIGVFLTRFFIEFIKNPQIAAEETMAINVGQILSIPFILAGILMIAWPYTRYKLELNANKWPGLKQEKTNKKK